MRESSALNGIEDYRFTAYLSGELPSNERATFEAWVGGETGRAERFAAAQAAWISAVRPPIQTDIPTAWKRVRATIFVNGNTVGLRNTDPIRVPSVAKHRAMSESSDARRQRNRRSSLLQWLMPIATVAIIVLISVFGWHGVPLHGTTRLYTTNSRQRATVLLDDGTHVTLSPHSMLRLVEFSKNHRTVFVDGEAYFEVTHTAGVPFDVRSGSVTTRVLGTAFLVKHAAGSTRVRVAVTDGKVRVTRLGRVGTDITLTTGQTGDITDSTAQVSTADIAPGTEWLPGRIIFHDTPLSTVLQTISQWYGYQFRYADQTLGAQLVTITVSTRSSAEALAAIEEVVLVNLTVTGDTVTLVPRPRQPGPHAPRLRMYDIWSPKQEVGR